MEISRCAVVSRNSETGASSLDGMKPSSVVSKFLDQRSASLPPATGCASDWRPGPSLFSEGGPPRTLLAAIGRFYRRSRRRFCLHDVPQVHRDDDCCHEGKKGGFCCCSRCITLTRFLKGARPKVFVCNLNAHDNGYTSAEVFCDPLEKIA